MKKNGFTLAEVLITLAIIGVVATMTLPALMSNTAEQQAKSALKKGINTLTEAAATAQAIDGVDYATITAMGTTNTAEPNLNTFYGILTSRTKVDFTNTLNASVGTDETDAINTQDTTMDSVVFLQDGSAILYNSSVDLEEALASSWDGLPQGIVIVYDTNGVRQPNILSNCTGDRTGADADADYGDDRYGTTPPGDLPASTCTNNMRVIRDQFKLRLRGTQVVPEGDAAVWAYNS